MAPRRRGFTLLEVLVTLAIVGLVLGVATTRFHTLFARSRLEASGQGLGDHFAVAISRSYTTGRYHTLVFDLTSGAYWIQPGRQDDESATPLLERRLSRGVRFTDIQLGSAEYRAPGVLSVEVSPLGVTNDILVNLEDEEERTMAVFLNALVQGIEFHDAYTTYAELQDPSGI